MFYGDFVGIIVLYSLLTNSKASCIGVGYCRVLKVAGAFSGIPISTVLTWVHESTSETIVCSTLETSPVIIQNKWGILEAGVS